MVISPTVAKIVTMYVDCKINQISELLKLI